MLLHILLLLRLILVSSFFHLNPNTDESPLPGKYCTTVRIATLNKISQVKSGRAKQVCPGQGAASLGFAAAQSPDRWTARAILLPLMCLAALNTRVGCIANGRQ